MYHKLINSHLFYSYFIDPSPVLLFLGRCPVEGLGPGGVISLVLPLLHQDPPLVIVPVLFHCLPVVLDSFARRGWGQGIHPRGDTNQAHGAGQFTWGVGSVHGVGALDGWGDGRSQWGAGNFRQGRCSCHFGVLFPVLSYATY